ncbi:MAG: DUF5012 domain-containing protein [Saprospiraceae bacterium]|nr:DUF5012 domain-containing protein [Candidatus Opimibacter iunctus]
MKSIINLIKVSFVFGALFTISSCNNEPEISNISRITYFPTFVYEGGDFAIIPCASDFEIPPIVATENGQELPLTVVTKGISGTVPSVDINKADIYVETTSAVNQDGYAGEVVRTFWVACTGDLVSSIEGLYSSTVIRNGAVNPQYFDLEYVLIRKVGANQYEVSCAIGGYYEFGRAYGSDYRAPGVIVTATDIPSNTFSFSGPVPVGAFGGACTMTSMTVDPATKTIHFTSDWDAGFAFDVTLTQVAL